MREKLRMWGRSSKTLPKWKIAPIVCINALEGHLKILRFHCLFHPWPWIWQPYFCVHFDHSIKVNVNTPYSIQLKAHLIWWWDFQKVFVKSEMCGYKELDVDVWNVLMFDKFIFQEWDPSNIWRPYFVHFVTESNNSNGLRCVQRRYNFTLAIKIKDDSIKINDPLNH
jgi:hypothetical protein